MDWTKLGYNSGLTPDLPFGYEALLPGDVSPSQGRLWFNPSIPQWLAAASTIFYPNIMPFQALSCRPIQAPTGPTNWLRHGYDADWSTADVVPSGYLPATAGLTLPTLTIYYTWNMIQATWLSGIASNCSTIVGKNLPVCVPVNFYSSSVAAATSVIASSGHVAAATYPNPMLGPGAMAWGYDKEWLDAMATIPVWAEIVAPSGVSAKIEIGDIYWDAVNGIWIQARSSVFGMPILVRDSPVARGVKSLNKTVTPAPVTAVWHCSKSPRCIQRENDVGYGCYLCGAKQT